MTFRAFARTTSSLPTHSIVALKTIYLKPQHCWRSSEEAMDFGTFEFKTKIAVRVRRPVHEANIVMSSMETDITCCRYDSPVTEQIEMLAVVAPKV